MLATSLDLQGEGADQNRTGVSAPATDLAGTSARTVRVLAAALHAAADRALTKVLSLFTDGETENGNGA